MSVGEVEMGEKESRTKLFARVRGSAWGFVLLVFVASRLFYLLAGALLARVMPIDPLWRLRADFSLDASGIWARMDGQHYLSVAVSGYGGDTLLPAFFPLYPLIVRSIGELLGGPISPETLSVCGVLVSLVAFLLALYFVYRIAEEGWGTRAAQRTIVALAFFPTSFFFNAVFTESLFLALSAGTIWAARVRNNLLLGCILAGFAAATRNIGVLLLIPLVLEWSDRPEYGWRRGAAYLTLASSGLIAYMTYLWWRFGDPLLFYGVQAEWDREPAGASALVSAFRLAYGDALALSNLANYGSFSFERIVYVVSEANELYNLFFFLFALTVLTAGWRLLPIRLSIYALAVLAASVLFAPVPNPLMSVPRYMLAAFPLFIVLGATVLSSKRKAVLAWWFSISVAASLVLTALFVGWYFVA